MRTLDEALKLRFGDFQGGDATAGGNEAMTKLARRGVVRRFKPEPLPASLLEALCAVALSSPTKSDLQQRDILIVEDRAIRSRLDELIGQEWLPGTPHLLVFLGNNRRQRQVHDWRGHAFANDHLDAFFNATVDAAIAIGAFCSAAEQVGVGCCPISVIRNRSEEVSQLLGLPDHVFAVAGLGAGWPSAPGNVSARLPLAATVHRDRFTDCTDAVVRAYDERRNGIFPYRQQRDVARFGTSPDYGWSEEKARHYAVPERADFGAFVRRKGFRLE